MLAVLGRLCPKIKAGIMKRSASRELLRLQGQIELRDPFVNGDDYLLMETAHLAETVADLAIRVALLETNYKALELVVNKSPRQHL